MFFCRGHPSAWVLQSFFVLSGVPAYSIGRIILSIKAISSVQGREQTYMGMYDVCNQCRRHLLSITPHKRGVATEGSTPF